MSTIRNYMKDWMSLAEQHNKEVLACSRDVLIKQFRTVKAKRVHLNNGSFRQKRARHYFGRNNHDVVVKSVMLESVYPIEIKMDTSNEDATGLVTVDVTFESAKWASMMVN